LSPVVAEAARMLVLPRPLREICDEILRFVEQAVPANRFVIMLIPERGGDPEQISTRVRGSGRHERLAISRAILDTVVKDCASVLVTDAALDERFKTSESIVAQAIRSAIAVPLFDNERVLGVLYADSTNATAMFNPEHVDTLTVLANIAAVKITNARL